MQKFPMTAEGLAKLEEELKQLKAEERPAVIRAIADARSHGDLSENAEYHASRAASRSWKRWSRWWRSSTSPGCPATR